MFNMLDFSEEEGLFDKFDDWWKDDLNIADAEPASSTRLDDSSVNSFIDGQKAEKTVKKTKSDMKTWYRWCESVGRTDKIETLSKDELNRLLSHFFIEVRKLDGENYEPGSLTDFQRSIDRYLQQDCGKKWSIIRDAEFEE